MKLISRIAGGVLFATLFCQSAFANFDRLKAAISNNEFEQIVELVKVLTPEDLVRALIETRNRESASCEGLRLAIVARITGAVLTGQETRSLAELAAMDPSVVRQNPLEPVWNALANGNLVEARRQLARVLPQYRQARLTPEGQRIAEPYLAVVGLLLAAANQPSMPIVPSGAKETQTASGGGSRKRAFDSHLTQAAEALSAEVPEDILNAVHAADSDSINKLREFCRTASDQQLVRLGAAALCSVMTVKRVVRLEQARRRNLHKEPAPQAARAAAAAAAAPIAMEQPGEPLRDPFDDLVAAAAAAESLPIPLSLEERAAALVPLLSREWSEDDLEIVRKFLIDVCIAQDRGLMSWLMMHTKFSSLLLLFQSLKGELVLELLKYCSQERLVAIYAQYMSIDFELAGQMLLRYRDVIMALWPVGPVQAGAQDAAQLAPPQLRAPGILW